MQIGQFSLYSSEPLSNALEKMPGNATLVSRDVEAAFDHSETNPVQNVIQRYPRSYRNVLNRTSSTTRKRGREEFGTRSRPAAGLDLDEQEDKNRRGIIIPIQLFQQFNVIEFASSRREHSGSI